MTCTHHLALILQTVLDARVLPSSGLSLSIDTDKNWSQTILYHPHLIVLRFGSDKVDAPGPGVASGGCGSSLGGASIGNLVPEQSIKPLEALYSTAVAPVGVTWPQHRRA